VINCNLSFISHRFRDIVLRVRSPKPTISPYPRLTPWSRGTPEFPHQNLPTLKIRRLATFQWKLRDPGFSRFVTKHSRYRQTDDIHTAYIMIIRQHPHASNAPSECPWNNERRHWPAEKHVFRVSAFSSPTPRNQPHYNPIPDPYPMVPLPFSSLLAGFLPQFDGQTNISCIIHGVL